MASGGLKDAVAFEGTLEKRGQAVLGKWEPHWFRLSQDSLDFFESEGQTDATFPKGRLALDQVSDVVLESAEGSHNVLSVYVGDRRVRLRAAPGGHSIEKWHQNLRAAVTTATASHGAVASTAMDTPRTTAAGSSVGTSASSEASRPPGNKTVQRMHELHDEHQRRSERLELKRLQLEEEEMRNIEESAMAAKGLTYRPARGRGSGHHASERLYEHQKVQKERLRMLREQKEESELRAIELGRLHARPTRSMSMYADPDLGTAEDACHRLYSDSFRRARDLDMKRRLREEQEERDILQHRVAVRSSGGSARTPTRGERKEPRWEELYQMAQERKVKLDKKREEYKKLEQERIAGAKMKGGVEPDERRALDAQRIDALHQEHLERQQRKREAFERERLEEVARLEREMQKRQKSRRRRAATLTPTRARDAQLWEAHPRRQRPSVRASMTASTGPASAALDAAVKAAAEDGSLRPRSATQEGHSPGAALLTSIETAVQHRSIDTTGHRASDAERKVLIKHISAAVAVFRDAANFQERDSGWTALCLRPSQRLVGSHLLCDPDRYARHVEPDALRQVDSNLDMLIRAAAHAQKQLKACIAPGVEWPVGAIRSSPAGVPPAMFALDMGCKPYDEAQLKAQVRYGPALGSHCARQLLDLARVQLVFASCDLIQAGIEHLVQYFEVVRVKNYYTTPTRVGGRYVEVQVVIHVDVDGRRMPHICELLLEHVYFHKGRLSIQQQLVAFEDKFRETYRPFTNPLDLEKVVEVARMTLSQVPEHRHMRSFRCHLVRHFGSTVCAWRSVLGNHQVLQFNKLQELCQSLKIPEQSVELWEQLEVGGCGGSISLWEFDPETCGMLLSFRSRALARTSSHSQEQDAEVLMQKLTYHVVLEQLGRIERHEFQRICKPLGYSSWIADKVFSNLDALGGARLPAAVTKGDLLWLLRMGSIVDIESIALQAYRAPGDNIRPRSRGPPAASRSLSALSSPMQSPKTLRVVTLSPTGSPNNSGGAFGWGASPTFNVGQGLAIGSPASPSSPLAACGMQDTVDREELDSATAAPASMPSRQSRILPGDDDVQPLSFMRDRMSTAGVTPRMDLPARRSLAADLEDEARRNLDVSPAPVSVEANEDHEESQGQEDVDELDAADEASDSLPEGTIEEHEPFDEEAGVEDEDEQQLSHLESVLREQVVDEDDVEESLGEEVEDEGIAEVSEQQGEEESY